MSDDLLDQDDFITCENLMALIASVCGLIATGLIAAVLGTAAVLAGLGIGRIIYGIFS